jgi:hypothetical protein
LIISDKIELPFLPPRAAVDPTAFVQLHLMILLDIPFDLGLNWMHPHSASVIVQQQLLGSIISHSLGATGFHIYRFLLSQLHYHTLGG